MTYLSKIMDLLGRKRVIYDRDGKVPYLIRYYLFLKERKNFPFNITLHKVLVSDEPTLHDHPWGYATFILKGGYWEHTPNGRFWRRPGSIRFARCHSLHRVELEPGVDVWTLFIPGPKLKEWGFIREGEWVQHEQYLREKYEN